jgi:ribonucleoside-diphosphate reductase beta chain
MELRSKDNKMYTKSVLLFSLFIEHVSLFSQFLIMMSFNKEKNLFKGISNVVEATSKEEEIHGNFGI